MADFPKNFAWTRGDSHHIGHGLTLPRFNFRDRTTGLIGLVLYSTTTIGNVAEVLTSISSNLITGNFPQHRLAIQSQGQPIAAAQAQFNVAVTGVNEE
jgi:hypothetical protein